MDIHIQILGSVWLLESNWICMEPIIHLDEVIIDGNMESYYVKFWMGSYGDRSIQGTKHIVGKKNRITTHPFSHPLLTCSILEFPAAAY